MCIKYLALLSLRTVPHNTCYDCVCLIFPWCYWWTELPVVDTIYPQSTGNKLFATKTHLLLLSITHKFLFREFIECVKIIRDATPNQYMVLVKFRSQVMCGDTHWFEEITNNHKWFRKIKSSFALERKHSLSYIQDFKEFFELIWKSNIVWEHPSTVTVIFWDGKNILFRKCILGDEFPTHPLAHTNQDWY